jgi:hypothetical protein
MSIIRVSFLLDTDQLGITDDVEAGIDALLLAPARKTHMEALQEAQTNDHLSSEDKTATIALRMRGMMASLMAQANMTVEEMPLGTEVAMELPFERDR